MNDKPLESLWLERDGTRLMAIAGGNGDAVLLIHGGMADHRVVLHHLKSLAERFRVIAPDQRGSGRSWCGEPLSFETLSDDLRAWLDDLGIARAVIVAASSGTGVAVHFALAHPVRVAGLALLQPIYGGAELGLTPEQAGMLAWMDGIASQTLVAGIQAIKPMYAAAPERFREQAIAMAMEYDPASLAATSHFLASGVQPFGPVADLQRIRVPVLLVRGADAMHPAAVSDLYAQALPHVKLAPQELPPAELAAFCAACFAPSGDRTL